MNIEGGETMQDDSKQLYEITAVVSTDTSAHQSHMKYILLNIHWNIIYI